MRFGETAARGSMAQFRHKFKGQEKVLSSRVEKRLSRNLSRECGIRYVMASLLCAGTAEPALKRGGHINVISVVATNPREWKL